MQTKIVNIQELRERFSRTYSVRIESTNFSDDSLLKNNPVIFTLIEKFNESLLEQEHNDDINFDYYKSICLKEVNNYIVEKLNTYEQDLSKLNKNIFSFFYTSAQKQNKINLIKKISDLNYLLQDSDKLSSLIVFKFENYPELIREPFFKFYKDQTIFLVVQDPISYLKVEESSIKDIFLVAKNDNSEDMLFEYEYLISKGGNDIRINSNQVQKFDGSKCIINYNLAIFVDLQEAKEHCFKVLNAIKLTVDEKINDIINFKQK